MPEIPADVQAEFDEALDAEIADWKQAAVTAFRERHPGEGTGEGTGEKSLPGWTTDETPVHEEAARFDAEEVQDRLSQNSPIIELVPLRQLDTFSCGAAAAFAVGLYYGVGPKTLDEWKASLGTNNDTEENSGTPPRNIVAYFESLGCRAEERHGMTVDDLAALGQQKIPCILAVQDWGDEAAKEGDDTGHYIVSCGVLSGDEDQPNPVRYIAVEDSSEDNVVAPEGGDGASGRVLIDEPTLLRVWHDRDASGRELIRFGIAIYPPENHPSQANPTE